MGSNHHSEFIRPSGGLSLTVVEQQFKKTKKDLRRIGRLTFASFLYNAFFSLPLNSPTMDWWKAVIAQPIVAIGVVGLTYGVWLATYRLWLSPLAHFPGPKLAAVTMWYEFYYDSFLEGQYTFRIAQMHRKHGPIVRISPFELHIDDPEYYEILYSRDKPRNKSLHLTGMFGAPASAFGSVDHRCHRIRRQPMNPFFSHQRIRQLEPMLRRMIDKLRKGMRAWKERDTPLHVYHAFNAYTTDVVAVSYTHLTLPTICSV